MKTIKGTDISKFLGKTLRGKNLIVKKPANLDECGDGDLVWVREFTVERLETIETLRPALVICDKKTSDKTTISHIVADNPRLDFIKACTVFFSKKSDAAIHPTAIIETGAVIGKRVSIGAYARIGAQVVIGDGCIIGSGVAFEGDVTLGKSCVIKANSVIGGQGFGFEYDADGRAVHFPHLGKIIIEDEVWIGACSTVEIGALGATKISRAVKVDDLVQVGHNVLIGQNTLVMANTVLCGGTVIGERCWIAPNSVVKEKVRIGNNVTIGLGSVVIRDIEDDIVVAGVPAVPIKPKNKR